MYEKLKNEQVVKKLRRILADSLPLAWHLAMFALGWLLAAAPVYEKLRPMGLSFAAAVIST